MGIPTTLQQAIQFFSNYENCKEFMVALRWPDGVQCPRCGSNHVTYLEKARVWKCYTKHDAPKFSLKTGTVFEDSPLGLDKWLPVMWMLVNCKNGVSSYEIHRAMGVTQKTAWFMLHRCRLAIQIANPEFKFSGEVEADETFVGGKVANMHLDKQTRLRMGKKRTGGTEGKAIVMGLLERHSRQVRVKVTKYNRAFQVRQNVGENVEKGATIYSDSLRSYRNLPVDGFVHDFIDHTVEYVRDRVHTNGLENFWSLMKRALKGTYVSVEPFHLQAYCDEQAFRFNYRREFNDAERFCIALSGIVGKRITYADLTGKEDETSAVS